MSRPIIDMDDRKGTGIAPTSTAIITGNQAPLRHYAAQLALNDRSVFYRTIRASLFGGTLRQSQVEGIELILDYIEAHHPQLTDEEGSYILATAYLETDRTMQPIREYGDAAYKHRMYDPDGDRPQKAAELGNIHPGDGLKYDGKGLAQVTGRDNARRLGRKYGYPLEEDPMLMLRPDIAVTLLVEGMIAGDYTGLALSDCREKSGQFNPIKARRIINGNDRAVEIASYYEKFLAAMQLQDQARAEAIDPPYTPAPPPVEPLPPPPPMPELPPDYADYERWRAREAAKINTKPPWASKIVVGAVATAASAWLLNVGVELPSEAVNEILVGLITLSSVLTGVWRIWFTDKKIRTK